MGGGKSSGSTSAVLTPEQKDLLTLQTNALKNTFMPAYEQTITGAKDVYGQVNPYATQAAKNTYENAAGVSNAQQGIGGELTNFGRTSSGAGYGGSKNVADMLAAGGQNLATAGTQGLMSLFSPDYKTEQIQASLQPAREAARESQAGQNAMYGAAGGLGSSRMALADRNLSSLNAQRQATAAANARAGVQANRANAATSIIGAGQNLANTGLTATGNAITAAQSPMDLYSKYAAVVYGTPQASTTPNFSGTQGTTGTSKGFRI